MPVVSQPSRGDDHKCLRILPNVPWRWGAILPLGENPWSAGHHSGQHRPRRRDDTMSNCDAPGQMLGWGTCQQWDGGGSADQGWSREASQSGRVPAKTFLKCDNHPCPRTLSRPVPALSLNFPACETRTAMSIPPTQHLHTGACTRLWI